MTWSSGRTNFICCFAIAIAVVSGCAKSRKLSTRLMPTPLALSLGLVHPGGDFADSCQCGDEDVPIFIVSGRNVEDVNDSIDPFGGKRTHAPTLGVAYVSVGEGLSAAELLAETTTDKKRKQAKVTFKRFELSQTPHSAQLSGSGNGVARFHDNAWVQAVQNQMRHSGSQTVTIFVHGYNTNFIDNTLIAAELHHYMDRKGAMMSFEWPSAGKLLGYIKDKSNASNSTRQFRLLISNIAKECNVDSITIIAHSAGAPIVVNALQEIRLQESDATPQQLREEYRIGRIVLAAPDMDVSAFTNAIQDRFYELTTGIAVYGSPKDKALEVSERLNGYSRLGHAMGELDEWELATYRRVPQIEMIDASIAEKQFGSFVGHGYFHRDPWVSSDIGSFLLGRSPAQRGLVKHPNEPVFWQFAPDYPARLTQLLGSRPISQLPVERVNFNYLNSH